ncbi:MAG: homoserine kinase [Planctomycetota bacterium]
MSLLSPALSPPLEVLVPASTSNVGPGFDLLGVALSLFVRVRVVEPITGGRHRYRRRAGHAEAWPGSERDLLFRAFDLARGSPARDGAFAFEAESEVPIGRGFGSSGAAAAAGLLLGAALSAAPRALPALLRLGIELEGHPDNVTASLHGGCTLCHPLAGDGGAPVLVRAEVHPSIGFVLAWPAAPLATERARAALPEHVPFADAVENPRRLALLLEGLRRGDPALLAQGGQDRLHTAHRLPLIPGAPAAMDAGRAAGAWLVAISGAGSGLVALGPRAAGAEIGAALARAFAAAGNGGEYRIVEPVYGTPAVQSRA